MKPLDKVILYGVFDGLNLCSDGSRDILVTLENGDRVEIPHFFVKEASDFVEKDRIKLKDIIARMEVLSDHVRSEWLDDILYKFGEEFGSKKYRDGYEQGKFEGEWVGQQLKDADKIRQELNKPVVPQFVADWIEKVKGRKLTLYYALDHSPERMNLWLNEDEANRQNTFARAWLDGYDVEKEKRYLVKIKGIDSDDCYLKRVRSNWIISKSDEHKHAHIHTSHTRKELEVAGFGEVFNSPLFEVEEVKE